MRKMWTATLESWVDPRLELEEIHAAAPRFAAVARFSARARDSGVPVSVRAAWLITLKDGSAFRAVVHLDPDAALAELTRPG